MHMNTKGAFFALEEPVSHRVDDRCRCSHNGSLHLDGITSHLRNLLNGRCTVHLVDGIAVFHGCGLLNDHRCVHTVLGGDLLAGVSDHLGDRCVDDRCGVGMAAPEELGISLGLGFSLLEQNGGSDRCGHSGAVAAGHLLASLFVGDLLVDHIDGVANSLGPGSAGLHLDFVVFRHTIGGEVGELSGQRCDGHLGVGLRCGRH